MAESPPVRCLMALLRRVRALRSKIQDVTLDDLNAAIRAQRRAMLGCCVAALGDRVTSSLDLAQGPLNELVGSPAF